MGKVCAGVFIGDWVVFFHLVCLFLSDGFLFGWLLGWLVSCLFTLLLLGLQRMMRYWSEAEYLFYSFSFFFFSFFFLRPCLYYLSI